MDYKSNLKSFGEIGIGVDYDPPKLDIPFEEGNSNIPKISYKQGIAFKPKFQQFTINTSVPSTTTFWASASDPG